MATNIQLSQGFSLPGIPQNFIPPTDVTGSIERGLALGNAILDIPNQRRQRELVQTQQDAILNPAEGQPLDVGRRTVDAAGRVVTEFIDPSKAELDRRLAQSLIDQRIASGEAASERADIARQRALSSAGVDASRIALNQARVASAQNAGQPNVWRDPVTGNAGVTLPGGIVQVSDIPYDQFVSQSSSTLVPPATEVIPTTAPASGAAATPFFNQSGSGLAPAPDAVVTPPLPSSPAALATSSPNQVVPILRPQSLVPAAESVLSQREAASPQAPQPAPAPIPATSTQPAAQSGTRSGQGGSTWTQLSRTGSSKQTSELQQQQDQAKLEMNNLMAGLPPADAARLSRVVNEAVGGSTAATKPEYMLPLLKQVESGIPVDQVIREYQDGPYRPFLERSPELYSVTSNLVSGSSQNTRDWALGNINRLVENGDTLEAVRSIDSIALRALPTTVQSNALEVAGSLDSMTKVKNELLDYYNKGKESGIIRGTFENWAQKIGKTTDPEFAAVNAALRETLMNYRRAITGAAFSDAEKREYDALMARIESDEDLNMALITRLEDGAKSKLNNIYNRAYNGSNVYGGKTKTEFDDLLREFERMKSNGIFDIQTLDAAIRNGNNRLTRQQVDRYIDVLEYQDALNKRYIRQPKK